VSLLRGAASLIWPGDLLCTRPSTHQRFNEKEIIIYSDRRSPECRRVERLLGQKGYHLEVVDITADNYSRTQLVQAAGRETVPLVFIDERLVGGLGEVKALDCSGDLDRMVRGEV
jgi:glutaredoxin 3